MCGLREVLASMEKAERRAAIGNLPPEVSSALLAHMERSGTCCGHGKAADSVPARSRVAARKSAMRQHPSEDERGVLRVQGGSYQAQVRVMCLRFTFARQRSQAAAVAQQATLQHLRRALLTAAAEDPAIWLRSEEISELVARALEQCQVRAGDPGLSVMVRTRATKFLGPRVDIVSPVLPLAAAVRLQARLLRARRSGWEAFRAVWMQLLTMRKHRQRRAVTMEDAREIVDGARRKALRAKCRLGAERSQRALKQRRTGRRTPA